MPLELLLLLHGRRDFPRLRSGQASRLTIILLYFCTGGETPLDFARDRLLASLSFCFTSAREERLELPTPGFGDQCSTN